MKRTLILGIAIMIAFAVSAQKNVTNFMGIPVDGTKNEMIQKLKAKGFTYNSIYDRLEGEFNGKNVYLYIGTNHNKVYRITVHDQVYTTAGQIKLRYNNLCDQFVKNGKYILINLLDYNIEDDEDISYEMSVHEKDYQAAYCQFTAETDTIGLSASLIYKILDKYGDKWDTMNHNEREYAILIITHSIMIEKNSHKLVWFKIHKMGGEYGIVMYYDNKLNEANGEDL